MIGNRESGIENRMRIALALLLVSSVARAQVGTTPEKSPFIDVEQRHEITVFGGYFSAKKDPAKVAPQSAPQSCPHPALLRSARSSWSTPDVSSEHEAIDFR